ncbi:MAG: hypothetical protein GEU96_00470 [Propionibacteriales bacterium]|nr:hypothetical protein [Propionibacteriales bacterium]
MTGAHPSGGDSTRLARTVAAYGLIGSLLDPPEVPLGEREFVRLHAAVRSQRMTGLLWAAITDDAFPVTTSQRDRALESHLQALAVALVLERLLVETVGAFEAAGIPVRALKGTASAHLDYPDPGMRTFGDIDLLVPSEAFDDAVASLTRAGNQRRFPQPRPGFDRRFSKGSSFRTPDGLEIDLHRTFAMGPFGARIPLRELWARSETYVLAGTPVHCLPVEERLLHATYHAVLGGTTPRLVPLRDVAQILLTQAVDVGRMHRLMSASRGDAVVARAIRLAWHELCLADVLALSAWSESYREDRQSAAELAVYGTGTSYAAKSFATVKAIPSLTHKARFAFALALPERSYLEERQEGRAQRIRRGLAQILSLRSGR